MYIYIYIYLANHHILCAITYIMYISVGTPCKKVCDMHQIYAIHHMGTVNHSHMDQGQPVNASNHDQVSQKWCRDLT